MNRWIILITLYDLAENFGLAACVLWILRRRQPYPRGLAVAAVVWSVLMGCLFALAIMQPEPIKPFLRDYLYFPLSAATVWNVLFLQMLFPASLLVVFVMHWRNPRPVPRTMEGDGISRRHFIRIAGYAAVPALATGMGVYGTATREDLRLRRFDLPVAGLPPELQGFKIAHISDLHSGVFVGPERLKRMSDLANDLKADLVAVTGDLINREMREFPDALESLRRVESRYGMFLCEGNHDVSPGPGLVLDACTRNGLRMLYNSGAVIAVNGKRVVLAGLPWMVDGYQGRPEIVSALFPERLEGDVRVLLAHHPHLFDEAASADVVLSGHTHGGQIMLSDEIGLGRLRFKYCSGLYRRGNTTLIVNNGCGDWFPCRIGAPAEIGLLRLTKAV
jgi:predicted MPP superfamily phosphohydrolase